MTQPSLRPPPYLQPPSKSVPTFSSTPIAALSSSTTPQLSRPSSQSRRSSPARSTRSTDVSDKATAALIRRVLCPNSHATEPRPIHELLPPLTSSNDVDLQLYAIIAIIVKDLVQSWYGKITPDQQFVEEVVKIVAHCTRALESRLRTVDLESLLLDEIPGLVERHVLAYGVSHQAMHPPPLPTDPRVIYHNLNPHPALSPVPDPAVSATIEEQSKHEAEYRQLLVQGALAILLPTEDIENACLRTLVTDVIAETILGNSIGGKVCEGWFIWSSITKLIEAVKAKVKPKATGEEIEVDTRSRLESFGLLTEKEEKAGSCKQSRRSTLSSVLWRILQYGYLTYIIIWTVILGLVAASSQAPRSLSTTKRTTPIQKPDRLSGQPPPILRFRIFPLVSILLDLPQRMPWLCGTLALLQHHLILGPLQLGATDGILDQYLHHTLTTHLSASLLSPSLALIRQSLFPRSSLPPPAPPPPSPTAISAIKRDTALAILSMVPAPVAKSFFGGDDDREAWLRDIETGCLDVWGDAYLNKHLGYALLELVLIRVLPELGDSGIKDLVEGRLGV